MYLNKRLRRNRRSKSILHLVEENRLDQKDFVYPVFIHDSRENAKIESMPGQRRWSLDGLLTEIESLLALSIKSIILFPVINNNLKTKDAKESFNPKGLVPKFISRIKKEFPELCVMTDIALDPYNIDGHDGLVSPNQEVLNDETVAILCKQALSHAQSGCDIVAPSDMMDGRVKAIRNYLDENNFTNTGILSYSAKYASAFYGPFRGALDSAPKLGDKKTYQLNPANSREAILESLLDIEEGADMIMIKPAMSYLDIIYALRQRVNVPIGAYQVSGEYLMIKSAADSGWLNEKSCILESLISIKRSGADFILTYFAKQAAEYLME